MRSQGELLGARYQRGAIAETPRGACSGDSSRRAAESGVAASNRPIRRRGPNLLWLSSCRPSSGEKGQDGSENVGEPRRGAAVEVEGLENFFSSREEAEAALAPFITTGDYLPTPLVITPPHVPRPHTPSRRPRPAVKPYGESADRRITATGASSTRSDDTKGSSQNK